MVKNTIKSVSPVKNVIILFQVSLKKQMENSLVSIALTNANVVVIDLSQETFTLLQMEKNISLDVSSVKTAITQLLTKISSKNQENLITKTVLKNVNVDVKKPSKEDM